MAGSLLFFIACSTSDVTPKDDEKENEVLTDATVGCTDSLATNFKSTAKTEDCSCTYKYTSKVSKNTPASFKRYALIEEYTGTWCGWCPMGKEQMEKILTNYAAVGVEIHYNDEMEARTEVYNPLKKVFGSPAFPTGMVNRRKSVVGSTTIMGVSDWEANVKNWLEKGNSTTGIALESVLAGSQLQVLTHLKFTEKFEGNYGLAIYLVEDKVSGYPQMNYLSRNQQFTQYKAYNQSAEIADILHHGVVRGVIAPITNGHPIPTTALKDGKTFSKLFNYKLPPTIVTLANCRLVAFVLNDKNEVLNVRSIALNITANWE